MAVYLFATSDFLGIARAYREALMNERSWARSRRAAGWARERWGGDPDLEIPPPVPWSSTARFVPGLLTDAEAKRRREEQLATLDSMIARGEDQ
jgi:hypothetical protein